MLLAPLSLLLLSATSQADQLQVTIVTSYMEEPLSVEFHDVGEGPLPGLLLPVQGEQGLALALALSYPPVDEGAEPRILLEAELYQTRQDRKGRQSRELLSAPKVLTTYGTEALVRVGRAAAGLDYGLRALVTRDEPTQQGADRILTILAVSDLARAVTFYQQAFAWPVRFDSPAFVELALPDGASLGLYQRAGFAKNTGVEPMVVSEGEISGTELYLHRQDLQAVIGRLQDLDARQLAELAPRRWGDEAAYFADPDGNVLGVAWPLEEEAE